MSLDSSLNREAPDEPALHLEQWVAAFGAALRRGDPHSIERLFVVENSDIALDAWWRDLVVFSWDFSAHRGRSAILALIAERGCSWMQDLRVMEGAPLMVEPSPLWGQVVGGFFSFDTPVVTGQGYVRLVPGPDSTWVAWTVLTAADELKGREQATRHRRPVGDPDLARLDDDWLANRRSRSSFDRADPQVLVVGGGHNGLGIAASLELMGVDTLVVERNQRLGDNWRKRYRGLNLHSPVWRDHMPYLPFPESWPIYAQKDKIGDWLECYAMVLDLNVWCSSEVLRGTFDEQSATWTVLVRTPQGERVLHPKQVIMATGDHDRPVMPAVPGREKFAGEVLHSSAAESAEGRAGQRIVVVGAGTSAHDVAQILHHGGAEVTMVQRSATYVWNRDTGTANDAHLYSQTGLKLNHADLVAISVAWPLALEMSRHARHSFELSDKALLDGLREAGFALSTGVPIHPEDGPDGLGCDAGALAYFMRAGHSAGGYYPNIGCSELIVEGKVKVAKGSLESFTETGIRLDTGQELDADVVVLATGFTGLADTAETLFGKDVRGRLHRFRGLDHKNELGVLWRPSGFPGLWFIGYGFGLMRQYGKLLAIQIAARLDGIDAADEPTVHRPLNSRRESTPALPQRRLAAPRVA